MKKPKLAYYLATTGTIHLVAELPHPKRDGFVQCGKIEIGRYKTILVGRDFVKKHPEAHICKRCEQLAGV